MTYGLLPEGLRDRLAPQAEAAAALLRTVIDRVGAHGYTRVSPPLAEFEEELVGRLKSAKARDLLRFVDPVSQRTLALRPDITAQIGRIVTTRLANAPRPLRLSYGGPVLKLKATQLRPERELVQAGAELIGNDGVAAAIEVISIAIESLRATGVTDITLDLTMPDLVDALSINTWPLASERIETVKAALDAKDVGALMGGDAAPYLALVTAAGPIDTAIAALRALSIGAAIELRLSVIEAIAAALPAVRITLDPAERHGFEYQSWLGFSLFAGELSSEAGRGGSYTIVHRNGREEPAIGFSLYLDPLIDAGLMQTRQRRVFVPIGADAAAAARLRAEGWITIAALDSADTPHGLSCDFVLENVDAVALSND